MCRIPHLSQPSAERDDVDFLHRPVSSLFFHFAVLAPNGRLMSHYIDAVGVADTIDKCETNQVDRPVGSFDLTIEVIYINCLLYTSMHQTIM